MKTIKMIDLVSKIKGNKHITSKKIELVLKAVPKVIMRMLLNKKEVKIMPFVKLGFKVAKDRMVTSSFTKEKLHMPQHLRFKATFNDKFKHFINNRDCK